MKARVLLLIFCVMALSAAVFAQDASQAPGQNQYPDRGEGGQGRRGGGGFGGGMGGGRGLIGTVTEVAGDHYTIKTDAGDVYKVSFSVNTRIMKQPAQRQGPRDEGQGGEGQRTPPQMLKPTDIKVGDPVIAIGQVDATAKTVGAVTILQVDAERAKQMREMQANFGKSWLIGKVTGVEGVKLTLMSSIDNAAHSFVVDENTTFRKRREPITLADVQVGDTVRAEGAVKDGTFLAATVNVMGTPPGGTPNVPRDNPGGPPR